MQALPTITDEPALIDLTGKEVGTSSPREKREARAIRLRLQRPRVQASPSVRHAHPWALWEWWSPQALW